jgi:hypothetical protein
VAYDLTIMKDGTSTVVKDIRATEYATALSAGSYSWSVVAHTPVGRSEPSDVYSFTLLTGRGSGVGNPVAHDAFVLHDVFVSSGLDKLHVSFGLGQPEVISLSVIGIDGRRHMRLDPHTYEAGEQRKTLDIRSLASGVYLLELWSSSTNRIGKFMVVR